MAIYKYWSTVNLDVENDSDATTVAYFLQNEFCPDGADIMWSAQYLRWKLGVQSPGGAGILSCAMHNDEIVGVASLTKKRVLFNGIELIAAEVGDTYTLASMMRRGRPERLSQLSQDPSHYVNKSIFGRLISDLTTQATEDGVSFIYGTPNKNSYPGYTKKLGYLAIEKYQNTRYLRPTSNLLVRTYKVCKPLEPIIKIFESFFVIIQNYIYERILYRGFEFSKGVPSEDEFNKIWTAVKPIRGFTLVRDYKYWKHRYLEHPIASYEFFTIYKDGILMALAVTRKFASRKDNNSIAIVEWMMMDDKYFPYILSCILKFYQKENVSYYYYWSDSNCEKAPSPMQNLFFIKNNVPLIFAGTSEAKLLLSKNTPLAFYLGSSDAI